MINIYIYIKHYLALHQKLIQHYKSPICQLKNKNKEKNIVGGYNSLSGAIPHYQE